MGDKKLPLQSAVITDDNFEQYIPQSNYREGTSVIVTQTGFEFMHRDDARVEKATSVETAVDYMNANLNLGWDDSMAKFSKIMNTLLTDIGRFNKELHLQDGQGETTGVHQMHAMMRPLKIFPDALERSGKDWDAESVSLYHHTVNALGFHDPDELYNGANDRSLAQQNSTEGFNKDLKKLGDVVVDHAMHWIGHAIEQGDDNIAYETVDKIRIRIAELADMDSAIIPDEDAWTRQIMELLEKEFPAPAISAEMQAYVDTVIAYEALAEGKDGFPLEQPDLNRDFITNFVKLAEHIQGSAHIDLLGDKGDVASPVNFREKVISKRDNSGKILPDVPNEQDLKEYLQNRRDDIESSPQYMNHSYGMVGQIRYREGEIGNLFAAANTDFENDLAIEAKKMVYNKVIKALKDGPPVIDRKAGKTSEPFADDLNRVDYLETLINAHVDERRDGNGKVTAATDRILDVESQARLIRMYEFARDNDNFIPKAGQVLIDTPPDPRLKYLETENSFQKNVNDSGKSIEESFRERVEERKANKGVVNKGF